ncbi:class I SAM-dependent methyltransferase [Fontibacter flavus]|uniref:Class I SAM-dependent methyltransferase n=1 Tax=Fontibacter flavus TaxID=654838 RepID=A0ABV6FRC7_9BACT
MPTDKRLSCSYCGHEGDFTIHHVKEMMFGSGEHFDYASCSVCGSLQLVDVPANLGDYYPKDYYSFQELVQSSPFKNFLKLIRYSLFRVGIPVQPPVFGDWMVEMQVPKHARIADVGCGNGQLLYEMYAAGFIHLEGYDPFIDREKTINPRLSLFKKSVFEMEGSFDLIMMHHALEHMESPDRVLEQCFGKLNKGGWLLVRIPVSDAQVWKDEGINWVQLDAPRHLTIPSVKGLTALAEGFGFKAHKVVFDSTVFQFWGTELYKGGVSLRDVQHPLYISLTSAQRMKEYQQKALLYNQKGIGDQACLYFYKG